MYKLLIVDDEPLVQVGIKSMLNWSELNIEVIGTAVNGQAAFKMIEEQAPDIVITDIKMPVMNGLELIRLCRERCGSERPCFIILTSYENFHMVKEAITYQVTDYLVKLELTPETLKEAINRVMERIRQSEDFIKPAESIVHPFYDKFFIRLLNNLFESEEQFILQSRDLNLDFNYSGYICCYGEMASTQADALPMEKQLALFSTSMQMLKELAGKYHPCYGLSLDTRHFALIFCYENPDSEQPVSSLEKAFNISLFKGNLTKAFEEYDAEILSNTLDSLCELFLAHPHHFIQAMDGACNILFLSISLLQDGEKIVSDFFRDNPDGYRSIYTQTTVEQIVNWLGFFKRQLCQLFEEHHKDYKNHIVTSVKKYIGEHVSERLSLNEVAAVFGISPNYLSQLFGRYSDMGFSEYINTCKVNQAKQMLDEGNLKVYEIAEKLGFESSFYFSKVFKKVEGISPTDYLNGKF